MASPVLPKGEQNFIRFVKICLDVLKLPLADTLASEIQPADLYNKIQHHCSLLIGKNKLSPTQMTICYLSPPAEPNYNTFDVTLLYKLLRNLCPSLEPTNGWGKDPVDADIKIGDDIERLRIFRNNNVHHGSSEITDIDFDKFWKKLKSVLQRIQNHMTSKGYKVNYEENMIKIKQLDLGDELIDKYKIAYLMECTIDRLNQADDIEGPMISIEGQSNVLCGNSATFNAVIYPENLKGWSVTWQKIEKWTRIDINTNKEKYSGSTEKKIVIQSVCKEDEGEYRAILSKDLKANNISVSSNAIVLQAIGDVPNAEISTERPVYFGSTSRFKSRIVSCPSPDGVEWQQSNDGKTFESIIISKPKYYGSSCDPKSPLLIIPKVTFEDKLYYRLLVWNRIGKQHSNTVFLDVQGNLPNITISHGTCVSKNSITLIGDVFVYGNLPAVQNVFWTKNGEELDTKGSGGRYSEVTVDNPSLKIFEVNEYDAGSYQLTATNDVGSTTSDFLILDGPDVFMARPERKNGRIWFTVTIHSIPAPDFAQWSMKEKSCDTFIPIDENVEEFKGTSNALPHPVLVVNPKTDLENYCFQIEIRNFIGSCKKITPDETSTDDSFTNGRQYGCLSELYLDGGAGLKFAKLFDDIAEHFPEKKTKRLKDLIRYSNKVKDSTLYAQMVSARDCLQILCDQKLFTPWDVIFIQFLLKNTGCLELFEKCVAYAEAHAALCFYEKLPDDEFENVQFHVRANLSCYTPVEIRKIQQTVAAIVGCTSTEIILSGYHHSASFLVVLSIETKHVRKLLTIKQQEKEKLRRLNIDYFIVYSITIYLQSPKAGPTDSSSDETYHVTPFKSLPKLRLQRERHNNIESSQRSSINYLYFKMECFEHFHYFYTQTLECITRVKTVLPEWTGMEWMFKNMPRAVNIKIGIVGDFTKDDLHLISKRTGKKTISNHQKIWIAKPLLCFQNDLSSNSNLKKYDLRRENACHKVLIKPENVCDDTDETGYSIISVLRSKEHIQETIISCLEEPIHQILEQLWDNLKTEELNTTSSEIIAEIEAIRKQMTLENSKDTSAAPVLQNITNFVIPENVKDFLLGRPDVHSFGIWRNSSFKVLVKKTDDKMLKSELTKMNPTFFEMYNLEVEKRKLVDKPTKMMQGDSIIAQTGNENGNCCTGTLGGFVTKSDEESKKYALTCNHIFPEVNEPAYNQYLESIGSCLFTTREQSCDFAAIEIQQPFSDKCDVCVTREDRKKTNARVYAGSIKDIGLVHKIGAKTDVTKGRILSPEWHERTLGRDWMSTFLVQGIGENFSEEGDSGSLVFARERSVKQNYVDVMGMVYSKKLALYDNNEENEHVEKNSNNGENIAPNVHDADNISGCFRIQTALELFKKSQGKDFEVKFKDDLSSSSPSSSLSEDSSEEYI